MKAGKDEHRTSNVQHRTSKAARRVRDGEYEIAKESPALVAEVNYDLEERLLAYAAAVIRLVEELPNTRAGNHIAGQLLRSGTSALPNHGEAQAAESSADFVHKLKLCLKELRESERWLKLIVRVPLLPASAGLVALLAETDQMIRIFVASIRTAQKRRPS